MPLWKTAPFLLLLAGISLAFLLILWPFSGAIVWGTVFAIVFAPLYRTLLRLTGQRENLAALAAVTLILLIVILPLGVILTLVFREAVAVYGKGRSRRAGCGAFLSRPVRGAAALGHRNARLFRLGRFRRGAAAADRRADARQPIARGRGAQHRPKTRWIFLSACSSPSTCCSFCCATGRG
jgi:hypothetical protein